MAGNNRPPETILSSPALKLSARGAKQGEYAKFGWQFAFNALQATFFTGAKEGDNRFINIKVPAPVLQMYCNELINASLPGLYEKPVEFKFTQGRGSDEKPAGSLIVGKDEDGLIWTTIAKDGFPRIKFYFTMPMGVQIGVLGGGKLSDADISSRRARAHAESLAEVAILCWGQGFDPNENNNFNKPSGGNGYGNKSDAGGDDGMDEAVTSSGW